MAAPAEEEGFLTVPSSLWRQMVRDHEGRWKKYENLRSSVTGDLYFYGYQPKPVYDTTERRELLERYVNAYLETRGLIVQSLREEQIFSSDQFVRWLNRLHCKQAYKGEGGKLDLREAAVSQNHSAVIKGDILRLAQRYGDPYATGATRGSILENIPEAALPRDEKLSAGIFHHFYTPREYFGYYYEELYRLFGLIVRTRAELVTYHEFLPLLAQFYQILANLRMFHRVNNSLYMNIVNAWLELSGLSGIEHGILDFTAMRLSPPSFTEYFVDEVRRVNPALSLDAVVQNREVTNTLSPALVFRRQEF